MKERFGYGCSSCGLRQLHYDALTESFRFLEIVLRALRRFADGRTEGKCQCDSGSLPVLQANLLSKNASDVS